MSKDRKVTIRMTEEDHRLLTLVQKQLGVSQQKLLRRYVLEAISEAMAAKWGKKAIKDLGGKVE